MGTERSTVQQGHGQTANSLSTGAQADTTVSEALQREITGQGVGQSLAQSADSTSPALAGVGQGQSAGRGQGSAGAEDASLVETSDLEMLHRTVTEVNEELLLLAHSEARIAKM